MLGTPITTLVDSKMPDFDADVRQRVDSNATDEVLRRAAGSFMVESIRAQYSYNFSALGCPIIQYPQDIIALQEIIWRVRPELIVETGIARGGSLVLSASSLMLLDCVDAISAKTALDPATSKRRVLGIDIDIRPHTHDAIGRHPLNGRIDMIEGSSVAPEIIAEVRRRAAQYKTVLVLLDSNHTHSHVLAELEAYADLVTVNSYCVVFDTVIEDLPDDTFPSRPWGKGDNAKTAVHAFLSKNGHFEIDKSIQNKLLITAAPDGYLKRIA